MAFVLSMFLLGLCGVGTLLLALQVGCAVRHLRNPPPLPTRFPPISILKPLCGLDDDLEDNLNSFGRLTYPNCEVLLGVERVGDPAYRVACKAAARWPMRMRVVVQHGAPGLNPKVNQLITLTRHARYDLLVVSDSNVAVHPEYLHEIAAHFEDDRIGVVTHPIAGQGACTLGSFFDIVHLSASISPGMIAANRIARMPLVVGKSMALRRAELRAIGGFEAMKDVLAEDYMMGRLVASVCNKQVAIAHRALTNVSCRRSLGSFLARYVRWNVLQRNSVGLGMYCAALLLNPLPFVLAALAITPTRVMLLAALLAISSKGVLEQLATRAARGQSFPLFWALTIPAKDLLLFACWLQGLLRTEIAWRGHRVTVLEGTRLVPVTTTGTGLFARKNRATVAPTSFT